MVVEIIMITVLVLNLISLCSLNFIRCFNCKHEAWWFLLCVCVRVCDIRLVLCVFLLGISKTAEVSASGAFYLKSVEANRLGVQSPAASVYKNTPRDMHCSLGTPCGITTPTHTHDAHKAICLTVSKPNIFVRCCLRFDILRD